ncbi:MAG: hypothetical protein H6574_16305 [Lewinellaceae bacterium]|nr:hypothetical protein [Lewinellaceae bacterium]
MRMIVVPGRFAALKTKFAEGGQAQALLQMRLYQNAPDGRVLRQQTQELTGSFAIKTVVFFRNKRCGNTAIEVDVPIAFLFALGRIIAFVRKGSAYKP